VKSFLPADNLANVVAAVKPILTPSQRQPIATHSGKRWRQFAGVGKSARESTTLMTNSIDPIDPFNDPDTLFGRLRSACSSQWDAYCGHEFVRRIGDATLAEERFRHYLLQDYLFLIHFSYQS